MSGVTPINIRNLSIKCGQCETYQTLVAFSQREEWNVYAYECENDRCDPDTTRTLVEVPQALDEFANRDPSWRGGARHGGAHDEPPEESAAEPEIAGSTEPEIAD